MQHTPGAAGPILIIDGTPKSGIGTLVDRLFVDLEITLRLRPLTVEHAGSYGALHAEILEADQRPILIPRLLTTVACHMHEGSGLLAEQWSILDGMCARRNGRLICLVDTPASIESRIPEAERAAWPRERLARWLSLTNQALRCSTVARKGSYILPQFINPLTGETTAQYHRLVGVLRGEIEAARCQRAGEEMIR